MFEIVAMIMMMAAAALVIMAVAMVMAAAVVLDVCSSLNKTLKSTHTCIAAEDDILAVKVCKQL